MAAFDEAYKNCGHRLVKVRIGNIISHDPYSISPTPWKGMTVYPRAEDPEDARSRNLRDGSEVRVSNNFGEITTEVVLDESLTRGTVAITHGWGHQQSGLSVAKQHPGTNANNLLPSGPGSYEKISNQSFMTGIPVDVEAA